VEDAENGSRWQLASPSDDIKEDAKKAGKI